MNDLLQDLRFGLRELRRRPLFALLAVTTLALGIGVNAGIFGVARATVLAPLPFEEPDRLVTVWAQFTGQDVDQSPLSEPELVELRQSANTLSGLEAYVTSRINLTEGGDPEQVMVALATPGLIDLLGVQPEIGRSFTPGEGTAGNEQVVLVSRGLWDRRFGGDPASAMGDATLFVEGDRYTVIGIAPEALDLVAEVDVWAPLVIDSANLAPRGAHYLRAVGRLAGESTVERTNEELAALAGRLQSTYPDAYPAASGWNVVAPSLEEHLLGDVGRPMAYLVIAGLLVLLIAAFNVAALLVTRTHRRRQELAIRSAFGAGRGRLLRQLLAESLLLAFLGGVVGLVLATVGLNTLSAFQAPDLPRFEEVSINPTVFWFTLGITLLAGIFAGLLPYLQLRSETLHRFIKQGGHRGTEGVETHRLRSGLVITQVAISLLVLVSASFLVENLRLLQQADPGFQTDGVLSLDLRLPMSKFPEPASTVGFYERLLERLESLPDVTAVGAISDVPLGDTDPSGNFIVEGRQHLATGGSYEASRRSVTPGAFEALGLRLREGRAFNRLDRSDSAGVVILDEILADRFWKGESAVGQRLRLGEADENDPWLTVVGVVGHVRHAGLDTESRPQMYFPLAQAPRRSLSILLHTSTDDPLGLVPPVRQALAELDPRQPIAAVQTMESRVDDSLARRRSAMAILGLFALVAVVLAVVGLYGAQATATAERSQELGVRMVLGAQRQGILLDVLKRAGLLVGIGVVVGLGAALAIAPGLGSQLYGLSPLDWRVYAAATALLLLATLIASVIPAWRATRVHPAVSLRHD